MKHLLALALGFAVAVSSYLSAAAAPAARPNILWLVAEDINAHLGCYGDTYARTPHLDKLAAKGTVYLNAWSTAPVCAPARTALITGMSPPALGAEHMRSIVPVPAHIRMYPDYLREAGYYCCNNAKTDYNLKGADKAWHESSNKAHYNKRAPGQPFMAVFNHEITHESRIRTRPHEWVHDPARAPVPPYHPDVLETRQDWAQYYDNITTMDAQVGKRLAELEEAGLAEDTIVFFYGDNGSGMPRHKRWLWQSGLRVPLIVYIPPKFRHLAPPDYQPGGRSERLVDFVDFAPTLLSLAGVRPPPHMHGKAFLGPYATPPSPYIFGLRSRMDENLDLSRCVRDSRYLYIRNYMPHKPYGQYLAYMFQTPTTRVWFDLFQKGQLTEVQSRFWQPKPPEELYDLEADPHQINNLANVPAYAATLQRLRQALRNHLLATRDLGFLPESELHERARAARLTPYEMGRDDSKYPLGKILAAAELASGLKPEALPALRQALRDQDSAVRYWGVMGILMRGAPAVTKAREDLNRALKDEAPCVRIAAAEALGKHGSEAERRAALAVLLELAPQPKTGPYVSVQALNALVELGPAAAAGLEVIQAAGGKHPDYEARAMEYAPRLVEVLTNRLAAPRP
ncbi:sulfatase-like hydrolase/transferase [Fontisphaera persica]|uniref:sulfatase-like hydrolase/transferase n=1 Tax=Fontisphaera persica TaxID=2974023 RepID=UPI0024BF9A08|nr:sulfatase-like hydrolase/transferase [Fontisphaera persica]WCJ58517.1 sulfatase-like hydrolase/transferase [Fontisphaera persica]